MHRYVPVWRDSKDVLPVTIGSPSVTALLLLADNNYAPKVIGDLKKNNYVARPFRKLDHYTAD